MSNINRKSFAVPASAKALALALGLAFVSGTTTVSAQDHRVATERYTEFADVISVQPVYQNIRVREPRQECYIETEQRIVGYERPHYEPYQGRRSRHSDGSGNALIGGLIGGVIGNQLGRGSRSGSRAGATIAGAIIGSAVGNETRNNTFQHRRNQSAHRQGVPIYETVEVERCREVGGSRLEQRIQHYDVTYQYRGRQYTTRLNRDPGNQIELQVSVAPARQ